MVNHAIFCPLGEKRDDTNLLPQTSDSLLFFNILLGDFLSPLSGRGSIPFGLPSPPMNCNSSDLTLLFYLRQIVKRPELGSDIEAVRVPVEAFAHWLEGKSFVEGVWFPTIGVQVDMTVERRSWIRICSNIGKHGFARLEHVVNEISTMIRNHGRAIDDGMAYAILPEFKEWFHTHLFAYHSSTIAEFLNNIRWGLYNYLRKEFRRAFHWVEPSPMYSFHVPNVIQHPLANTMYWELMNRCRSEPWFPRFSVTPSLKAKY